MKKLPPSVLIIPVCVIAGAIGGDLIALLRNPRTFLAGLASISAGDWLQALSAMIGVALTISATLWLEERKRQQARKEEQRLLRESLVMLKGILPAMSHPPDPEKPLANRVLLTAAHYELLRTGRDSLAYAREGLRIRNYNLWNALSILDTEFAIARDMLTREEAIIRGQHVTEAVLTISREKIEAFSQSLQAPVAAAMDALREVN